MSSSILKSPPAVASNERQSALQEFEATKRGVKGLVESGITTLPSIFVFPPLSRLPSPPNLSIPTIDLSLPDHIILPSIISAARNWGFFQLTNHSIPLPLIRRTLTAVRSFHSLPPTERSSYYNRSSPDVQYFSNVDLFHSSAASWRDTLRVTNCAAVAEKIAKVCRAELVEWEAAGISLAMRVAELLGEGLGVGKERLEKMGALDKKSMACHCYPPCPEPEKTMGVVEHKDHCLLTVLVQNEIGGLQVKMEGEERWVDVLPADGGIVVNIGNLLQIFSNDDFKSATHRVLSNSGKEDRISIAMFFNPGKNTNSDIYGPLPELVSEEKPARFRNFTMPEFLQTFLRKELNSSLVDHFRKDNFS